MASFEFSKKIPQRNRKENEGKKKDPAYTGPF